MTDFDWRAALRTVAPTVATLLGGPLAGALTGIIGQVVLGKGEGDPPPSLADATAAIADATMSPDGLVKLRELEVKAQELAGKLQVDLTKIAAEDRAGARYLQQQTRDPIPGRLAMWTVPLFFLLVGATLYGSWHVMTHPIQLPEGSRELQLALATLVGSLLTQLINLVKDIYGFYFGSSLGSVQKTETMETALRAATARR